MDPRDTYRNSSTTTTKMPAAISTALGAIIMKAPRPVATPLPPWNFSQTGNMCPTTADNAARAIASYGLVASTRPERYAASATAAEPFNASRTSVITPSTGDLRETFVAPMFPLPLWRTSSPWKMRTRR